MSGMVFKHYCGVKRDSPIGANGRTGMTTISVANRCTFIPMPSQAEIENQFTIGTGYDVYFKDPEMDVKAGDQLVWNAKVFNVRAARAYEVPGVGHVHVLATREGA